MFNMYRLIIYWIQEFKSLDKKSYIEKAGFAISESLINGAAILEPSILGSFILIVFADLKSYQFTHWLGMPAVIPEMPFHCTAEPVRLSLSAISSPADATVAMYRQLDPTSTIARSGAGVFGLAFDPLTSSWTLCALAEAWSQRYDTQNAAIVILEANGPVSNAQAPASVSSPLSWRSRNLLALLAAQHVGESREFVNIVIMRGELCNRLVGYWEDISASAVHGELQAMPATPDFSDPIKWSNEVICKFSLLSMIAWLDVQYLHGLFFIIILYAIN